MRAKAGSRSLAWLVDAIFVLALTVLAALILSAITGISFETMSAHIGELEKERDISTLGRVARSEGFFLYKLIDIVGYLISLLYGMSELVGTATPAKLLFGLRLGGVSGSRASFADRFTRYLIIYAPLIFILIADIFILKLGSTSNIRPLITLLLITSVGWIIFGIYYVLMLLGCLGIFMEDRLCLHDKISGVAVYVSREWSPESGGLHSESAGNFSVPLRPADRGSAAVDKLIFK